MSVATGVLLRLGRSVLHSLAGILDILASALDGVAGSKTKAEKKNNGGENFRHWVKSHENRSRISLMGTTKQVEKSSTAEDYSPGVSLPDGPPTSSF